MAFEFLTPEEAWQKRVDYRQDYYRKNIAAYSGDRDELNATSDVGMFWARQSKCKVHVPVAADIAAVSANLLFAEEPSFTCYDEETEDNESTQQKRLDTLVELNNIHGKLNEAAEGCAAPGDYDIKLTCTGTMGLYGGTSSGEFSGLLRYSSGNDSRNRAYPVSIQALYCANSVVSFGDGALFNCIGMSSIIIPNSVVSMGTSAIKGCNHLSNINIPNRVSSLGALMFTGNYSLRTITIPNSVTSFGDSIFSSCYSLENITIPDSVTSIGTYALSNCYNMHNFSLPDSLASISNNMIYQCYCMTIIDVPASVTSIGTQAMAYNVGLAELHFHRATPPTVANSNAFNNLPIDCKIYVPTGSLSAYTSATNYPSSSIYTYIEE